MIQHTVTFRLHDDADAAEFFRRVDELATLDGVQQFEVLQQVGKKNDFTHGLSMYFADQAAYDAYDAHPAHQDFVNNVWLKMVADFLELDYTRYG